MKPVIYIASDSTVMSYTKEYVPQTGWGQVLIEYFARPGETVEEHHPDSSVFPSAVRYDTPRIAVDNRAYAGRSMRTFWEEGRLDDIASCLGRGDYLFIQFAHNDANEKRPERFIPVKDYPAWLQLYTDEALMRGAVPVLVTAVAMRQFDSRGHVPVSFPEYRDAMMDFAAKKNLICLDLGEDSRRAVEELGPEKTKKLFMWTLKGEYPGGLYCEGSEDNAHLKREGALCFAGLLADEIRREPRLSALASELRDQPDG
ncbi:MAG: rhamnogalacturonan acetylesterase [Lachnospiraceae bacterium]|jgi:lysophospholipase L1-like esterase